MMNTTLPADDGVWVGARVSPPFELEIGGEMMSLPELGFSGEEEGYATVLLRILEDTSIPQVQILGGDLPVSSLAWSDPEQSAFLAIGAYYCDSGTPRIVADDRESLEALPQGCDMEPNDDQPGYIAALPRAL